jgi:hypothetical protein
MNPGGIVMATHCDHILELTDKLEALPPERIT